MSPRASKAFRCCSAFLVACSMGGLTAPAAGQSELWVEPRLGQEAPEHDVASLVDARPVVLEGYVLDADGSPVASAVVVSSAGGSAVSATDGWFHLEVADCPWGAIVEVTAAAIEDGQTVKSTVQVTPTTPHWNMGTLILQQGSGCSPTWLPTFEGGHGVAGYSHALAVFDDGGGSALYVGGNFVTAGIVPTNYIAKWDDFDWSALGSGMNSKVLALTVFDDGSGSALYAGGEFTTAGGVVANYIAKWNGSSWSALGGGVNGPVTALMVFDDGSGPALYVGGEFTIAGGDTANHIAKWDGSGWSGLGVGPGNGMDYHVYALSAFDDGSGSALYAGGGFTTAGGVAANAIARWNGSSWSALGGEPDNTVLTLTVFDDGSGSALFAGGWFTSAGGVQAEAIAKWDGSSWSPVGSGLTAVFPSSPTVDALAVFDDGNGPALYAGGGFTHPLSHVAKWDGSNWSGLESGLNGRVLALSGYDDGNGPALYAGGHFTGHVGRWSDSTWSSLSDGLNGLVAGLTVFDDSSGPALYAGGWFTSADGIPLYYIGEWNGSSWSELGGGVDGPVSSLAVFDYGSGPALYVGGTFINPGGSAANNIAKWDGLNWAALGSGTDGQVEALAIFDDGSGPALYVGGSFSSAGGLAVGNVARWDGSSWSALGTGTTGPVRAMTVFDDGGGPALYVGGSFTKAGGVNASRVAKWDGSSWLPLGSGMSAHVYTLAVFDDGSGSVLYAGGSFTIAGGTSALRIAKWDGSNWSSLGTGIGNGVNGPVQSLSNFDDGSGPALYVGGGFSTAGGTAADGNAKWSGSSWSAWGSELDGLVEAFTVFDDGNGPALYAGGSFAVSAGDSYLAKWGCATAPPTTYCTAGTSASGCQALLSATGTASATAASGFMLQAATVEGQKDGLFFFGTNGQQANPWGNGTSYQCVVPPVKRAPIMTGSGTIGLCDGAFARDLNALWCSSCPKPGHNPGVGATVQAQLWYRDPASTSNQTTSLSDAVEFVVAP